MPRRLRINWLFSRGPRRSDASIPAIGRARVSGGDATEEDCAPEFLFVFSS
jgi:hypothetical protein